MSNNQAPDRDSQPASSAESASSEELVEQIQKARRQLHEQVRLTVVGQDEVIDQLFVCLFTSGHGLLVGVPGLAKTLLVSTIAHALNLRFSRIQFTPDLMPSDITGTEVIEEDRSTGRRVMRYVKGPVFGNVILADEVNRTPPKTQAALLEAMQEHHVTAGGVVRALPEPFFVLATQNPIEQEGTYPLPEAQLDRFMFMIRVGYPSEDEELDIVKRTTSRYQAHPEAVLDAKKVLEIQNLVRDVPVADYVIRYALRLVRATRRPKRGDEDQRPEFLQQYLTWGAGPRASQYLTLAGKARAIMDGRTHVNPQDIRAVAAPVLRHRLITNFNAEADGVTTDDLIDQLVDTIPVEGTADPQADAVLH